MKHIQIIDGADNCTFDIFAATAEEFSLIFPEGQDVAFIGEVYTRESKMLLDKAFTAIWTRRIAKKDVLGIHGTLFYELEDKAQYYPSRRDENAIKPDGTALR
ncbi:MAG: hypothetical protein ACI9FG_001666 [Crocinitomicaceae bacterium]|jgi:hypothetical protein